MTQRKLSRVPKHTNSLEASSNTDYLDVFDVDLNPTSFCPKPGSMEGRIKQWTDLLWWSERYHGCLRKPIKIVLKKVMSLDETITNKGTDMYRGNVNLCPHYLGGTTTHINYLKEEYPPEQVLKQGIIDKHKGGCYCVPIPRHG